MLLIGLECLDDSVVSQWSFVVIWGHGDEVHQGLSASGTGARLKGAGAPGGEFGGGKLVVGNFLPGTCKLPVHTDSVEPEYHASYKYFDSTSRGHRQITVLGKRSLLVP